MSNPDRAPEAIPARDRMSPKNQKLFEEFQEMARPLHEKIARQTAEIALITHLAAREHATLTAERDALMDEKWSLARLVDTRNHEVQRLTAERDVLQAATLRVVEAAHALHGGLDEYWVTTEEGAAATLALRDALSDPVIAKLRRE